MSIVIRISQAMQERYTHDYRISFWFIIYAEFVHEIALRHARYLMEYRTLHIGDDRPDLRSQGFIPGSSDLGSRRAALL